MSGAVQSYLADATTKAAEELIVALGRIPEDKREWKPAETSRTARDMFVECVLLTGYTAEVVRNRAFPSDMMERYMAGIASVADLDGDALGERLRESASKVAAAIRDISDDAFPIEIVMPWQTQTLDEVIAYPYWNMSYHLGQINYIASILGCLN